MAEPTLAKSLDATQLASMSDADLESLGLNVVEIQTLRSLPPTKLSSMIPLVIAAGKKKAEHIQDILPFTPEVDTNGQRRCVYIDSKGDRCEKYGDKNTPVCHKHKHKAASLGTYFQSPTLRQTYDAFVTSPDKMKADGELALMRTMLATVLSKVNDENINLEVIAAVTTMSEKITQTVDRISKLEKITPEHLQNLMKKMVEIASDYIPTEKLDEFAHRIEGLNLDDSDIRLVSGVRYMPGETVDGTKIGAIDENVKMQKEALIEVAAKMGVVPDGEF